MKGTFFLRCFIFFILIVFYSNCINIKNYNYDSNNAELSSESKIIIFKNNTLFTVHIVRGSGHIDVATIAPLESISIINSFEVAETYYPLFEIPITDSWSLQMERSEYHFQVDNLVALQEIEINLPSNFNSSFSYIMFLNNSRNAGISISRNDLTERMNGMNFSPVKSNINVGEIIVYQIDPRIIHYLRVNPMNYHFGELTYQSGYLYKFIFDGNNVNLTDARPLTEIGAKAPMAVKFNGYEISESDKRRIIEALRTEFDRYNIPLRPLFPEEEAFYENRIFYSMEVVLNLRSTETIQGDLSIVLLLNGNELRSSARRSIRGVMQQSRIIQQVVNTLRELSDFYTAIISDIGI